MTARRPPVIGILPANASHIYIVEARVRVASNEAGIALRQTVLDEVVEYLRAIDPHGCTSAAAYERDVHPLV